MVEKEYLVESKHSAAAVGSGDLEVLSTPSLIAFMENAAKAVTEPELKDGETTVGIELQVQHLKATAIGETVNVKATLEERNHTILIYTLEAYEGETLIGKGQHKRAIVNANQFMENILEGM